MSSSPSVFSLEGQGLRLETAADIEPYLKDLRNNAGVREIRLGGNTFGVEACQALADTLRSKESLEIANLADIFTSRLVNEIPPALSALLTALLNLPRLHTVNLSDNAFGLNTQAPLVEFLSQHVPLRHLILNNNGLGPHAGVLIGDALTALRTKKEEAARRHSPRDDTSGSNDKSNNESGKGSTSTSNGVHEAKAAAPAPAVAELETIICGRNRLENGSMEAWARAIAAHGDGLRVVRMVQNGIRQEGVTHLLRHGLRHARRLRVLDLQDNTFTVHGSRALAEVLPEWADAQELGVGDCLLSAHGTTLLARAVAQGANRELRMLRLQYNDINAKALKALVDCARHSLPALQRVELNGNAFSEDDPSVEVLRELLEERREAASVKDSSRAGSQDWGLDSLSDLEDDSDPEDDDDDDEDDDKDKDGDEEEEEDGDLEGAAGLPSKDVDKKAEKFVKDDEESEDAPVPQEADSSVDALADQLGKAQL